jgi:DHA2 family multidrug resistance protein
VTFEAERASVRTNGKLQIDGIGIGLIALASAALEVALDRGQIDDWFGSPFISWLLGIAVAGWIATIVWELRAKEPVIDFRLLANRNFAIASTLFFVFGIGLFGSTTLIPQILQTLYGYRAVDAGLVLGPGALVVTLLAPITAQLIQRQLVPARVLLAISISTVGAAMWYFSTFTPATDYSHYALARAYQGLGYGFFFVPVNVLA